MSRITGAKYKILVKRAVKEVNEGFNLEEVAELMQATHERPDGKPFDAKYVYGLLHDAKYGFKMQLREGIRFTDQSPKECFKIRQQKYNRLTKPRAEISPSSMAWFALLPVVSGAVTLLICHLKGLI